MSGRPRQTDNPCNDLQRLIDQKDWDAVTTYLSNETIPSKTKYNDINDRDRSNAFQRALKNDAPLTIIEKIVHYGGGNQLIMEEQYGFSFAHTYPSIHLATAHCSADVVQFLLENGDAKKLLLNRKHCDNVSWDIPLCQSVNNKGRGRGDIHVTRVLLEAGMQYLANENSYMCGEYAVGGLFNCDNDGDDYYVIPFRRIVRTYGWDDVVTHLEPIIRGQPILQAFIEVGSGDEGLPDLFKQTMTYLGDWVVTTKDSQGLLPIQFAIKNGYGLCKWENGMKELLFKFSNVLQRDAIHVALEYGMKWGKERDSLNRLVQECGCDVSMVDWTSGLLPFMTAAATGSSSDLSTMYNLLLLNPSLVETESKKEENSTPSIIHDHLGQKRVRVS